MFGYIPESCQLEAILDITHLDHNLQHDDDDPNGGQRERFHQRAADEASFPPPPSSWLVQRIVGPISHHLQKV